MRKFPIRARALASHRPTCDGRRQCHGKISFVLLRVLFRIGWSDNKASKYTMRLFSLVSWCRHLAVVIFQLLLLALCVARNLLFLAYTCDYAKCDEVNLQCGILRNNTSTAAEFESGGCCFMVCRKKNSFQMGGGGARGAVVAQNATGISRMEIRSKISGNNSQNQQITTFVTWMKH